MTTLGLTLTLVSARVVDATAVPAGKHVVKQEKKRKREGGGGKDEHNGEGTSNIRV